MFLLFLCSDIDMVSLRGFPERNVFCLLLLHLDVWPSLCRKMFVQNVWLQKAVFTFIRWREGSISLLTLNLRFILDCWVTSQLVGGHPWSKKNATYTSVMWKVLLSELAIKVWEYLHIHSFWIVFKLIYSLEIVSTLVDDLYVILECLSFHELPPLTAATLSHVDKWCTSFLRPALSFGNKCFLKFLHLHLGALCKTRQLLSETWRLHQGALRHLPGGRGLLAAMGFPPQMPGRGGMGFAWGPYCLGVCCLSSRRDMCRVLGYPESHVYFFGDSAFDSDCWACVVVSGGEGGVWLRLFDTTVCILFITVFYFCILYFILVF